MSTNLPIHGLPQANAQFTVKKGTGPAAHNLETQLHHHALNTSSHLHPLKEHVGAITEVFGSSYIKNAIRKGGLTHGEQKHIVTKLLEKDKHLAGNTLKKNALKDLVKFYGKTHEGGGHAGALTGKALLMAKRARAREMAGEPTAGPGASSAMDLVRGGHSTTAAASTHVGSAAAPAHGGFANQNAAGAVTSIAQLMNKPKAAPGAPLGGGRPSSLPPRLVV